VVVGVVAVRVMKAAADAVVCVTAVRNHFMAAAGAVGIARLRVTAAMVRRAAVRGSRVTDGGVAGTRPMLVSMAGMGSPRRGSSCGNILFVSGIRGHSGAALGRLVNRVARHRQQVLVRESIEAVLRFVAPFDQTYCEQRL